MAETKAPSESLTTLQLQVDRKGQVHALTDAQATWILSHTIPLVNLLDTYHDLLKDDGDGLTAITLQTDPQGQVHAFAEADKTWKFRTPISVVDLVETYTVVLSNVAKEVKA